MNCGKEIGDDDKFCPECGARAFSDEQGQDTSVPQGGIRKKKCPRCGEEMPEDMFYCMNCGYKFRKSEKNEKNDDLESGIQRVQKKGGTWRNKWVSFWLCFFFGWLGIHKFYEGKPVMGLLYLFTLGLLGIGWIVDIVLIARKPNPYQVI